MNPVKVFTDLLQVNAAAGKFIVAGVLLFAAAAIVAGFGLSPELGLRLGAYLVVAALVVTILSRLPGILVTILGWFLMLLISAWLVAVTAQVISGNRVPGVATLRCLVFPLSEACQISTRTADAGDLPPVTAVTPVVPVAPSGPSSGPSFSVGTGSSSTTEEPIEEPVVVPATGPPLGGPYRVFVQFDEIERDSVKGLTTTLASGGWNVPSASLGGERLSTAQGLNEVRYFHPDDAESAEILAMRTEALLGIETVSLRSLEGTQFATSGNRGLLEIWVSG